MTQTVAYACHINQRSEMFAIQLLVNVAISTNLTIFSKLGLTVLIPYLSTSNIVYKIDTQYK